ncbi:hypothetical protein TVAG_205010 [Trichomonas vaginalis G3]|uniref:Uncharacterized protein n=1 Tax=Trichomonas vaginalis (strain ATCC PRA-98 / G3) TaxID=412133 RepID=A2EJ03_TRIV3|nr:hypothetical protein TVAGG3_0661790 [Trichomonas vaginalis G3]EAY07393.1 hypothetical protein TVAG_205010 [Trichomonas vaginalis G3]KAI5506546.1 hypothetical protein TVAGG3_0661790 [Trichomonas vaginalis G3]|eukprot:XP_001319616.1 hypothetical protein [Trichomonas vaginalis G3]
MLLFFQCESILNDNNAILKRAYREKAIEFYASGVSSQRINGTIQPTKPEYAFDQIDKRYDWCSNCGKHQKDFPWIIFSIKNHIMNLEGYFLKAGCCYDGCCCYDESKRCCECCLFSWSFQISNDNITWKTIHKVERDYELHHCREKTFKFTEVHKAKFARLIQDETCYGDPPCIALNKIELIGNYEGGMPIVNDPGEIENDEDDVSIIGHISKNSMH